MIAGIEKALNSSLPFGRATPHILFALSKCWFTLFFVKRKDDLPTRQVDMETISTCLG